MSNTDYLDILFVVTAFLIQIVLIAHFALRRWRFEIAVQYGWIIYALSIPAVVVSLIMLIGGKDGTFWAAGFIYLLWAMYGYWVEYVKKRQWRAPIYWPVAGPYLILYIAMIAFYWWPLGLISQALWYVYALLFIISTGLNFTSHKKSEENLRAA